MTTIAKQMLLDFIPKHHHHHQNINGFNSKQNNKSVQTNENIYTINNFQQLNQ